MIKAEDGGLKLYARRGDWREGKRLYPGDAADPDFLVIDDDPLSPSKLALGPRRRRPRRRPPLRPPGGDGANRSGRALGLALASPPVIAPPGKLGTCNGGSAPPNR